MERKETAKPILVTIGRNSARIYFRKAERNRTPRWQLADYSSGRRVWQTFESEKEARAEAARYLARMNLADNEGAGMTGADRRDLTRCSDLVAPFGLDAPTACALFAEAAALVGHENVVAACKAYARRSPAARTPLPVPKAVLQLLDAKESKGRSSRLLSDLRSRLGRFASDHAGRNLGDFTTASLQRWLDGLTGAQGQPLAPQTRNNFAVVVGGLFEFHRRRGAIPDNPCKDLERENVKRKEDVEFWTPAEAAALLAHADPAVKAGLVLSLFTGCRTAEACRLTWADVDLDRGHVAIAGNVAKTASRRLSPIPDNARAWLRPLVGAPDAPIVSGDPTRFPRLVTEAASAAGVRRIPNGSRHSAITYKVALSGDVARVALESGNSPQVIHAHYRGLATTDDAKAFFSIMPTAMESGVRHVA